MYHLQYIGSKSSDSATSQNDMYTSVMLNDWWLKCCPVFKFFDGGAKWNTVIPIIFDSIFLLKTFWQKTKVIRKVSEIHPLLKINGNWSTPDKS